MSAVPSPCQLCGVHYARSAMPSAAEILAHLEQRCQRSPIRRPQAGDLLIVHGDPFTIRRVVAGAITASGNGMHITRPVGALTYDTLRGAWLTRAAFA